MVKVVQESGFCHGVSAAVHRARELVSRAGGEVFLLGDLVNNRRVMAEFSDFAVVECAAEVAAGGVAVIRAHGVGRAAYDALAEKGAEVVDCTCVKVKSIHKIVASHERVIIIGKKNHPEVTGILGWCAEGAAVENEAELAAVLSDWGGGAVAVVAQTTCSKEFFEKASAIIKDKIPDAEIFDTLCNVTARRNENAKRVAAETDCMIIVGDKQSANSMELFSVCRAVNAKTFFVAGSEELPEIAPDRSVGIAGSASAPAETVEEIENLLLFSQFLARAKGEIETAADVLFEGLIADADTPVIKDALRDLHFQNEGGKRVRGGAILLGFQLSAHGNLHSDSSFEGGSPPEVLKLALAYEIFGTAILIHDDIIDQSEKRRGKRTIHTAAGDAHYAVSRAICIGDYGLFLASKILSGAGLEGDVFAKIMRLFAEIQIKTLEGEIMDISLPKSSPKIPEEYDDYCLAVEKIYESKTAWYTLAGPLMLGAICGGASDETVENLREIAIPLGLAFQHKDDLLDIFANEKILGKPPSDVKEKKQTFLYGYALKHCDSSQKISLDKIYGNPNATRADLDTVRDIFEKAGARAACEAKILELCNEAAEKISAMDIPAGQKKLLRGLAGFLVSRKF